MGKTVYSQQQQSVHHAGVEADASKHVGSCCWTRQSRVLLDSLYLARGASPIRLFLERCRHVLRRSAVVLR